MKKYSLKALLSGYVQGVGMRYYVKTQADQLGLTGYVRNLANGQVEVVAQGNKENLEKLCYLLEHSRVGRVDKIECQWQEPDDSFTDFEIRF